MPSMEYLNKNGEGSFINYMYQLGLTWQQLHEKYDIPLNSKLLARNNFYMDSHAEVCLVNFLWCRGIEIKKGEYYTNDYTKNTGRNGIYDLHFKSSTGIYKDTLISIEIWGGTKGHNEEEYNKKRKEKEDSHKDDNCFLGIEYSDCYKEIRLIKILEPYIGIIEPYIFKNEEDKLVPCTKWNLIDGIRTNCKYVMEHNNEEIPPVNWFLCKGMWANREKKDWEITNSFNGNNLVSAIQKFGGIKKVRELMNIASQNNRSRPHVSENMKQLYKYNDELKIQRLNKLGQNKPFDVFKYGEFIGTFTYQFQAHYYLQKEYNKERVDISAVLNGSQLSSKGFTFEYKTP